MKVVITIDGDDCGLPQRGRIIFGLGPVTEQATTPAKTPQHRRRIREDADVATKLTVTQETTVRIKAFKDRKGNAAAVDGVPSWATDDSDRVALDPAADGMSCKVKATGVLGDPIVPVRVQASADADLGEGVSLVIGTAEFDLTAGTAVEIELGVDPPTEQPE